MNTLTSPVFEQNLKESDHEFLVSAALPRMCNERSPSNDKDLPDPDSGNGNPALAPTRRIPRGLCRIL